MLTKISSFKIAKINVVVNMYAKTIESKATAKKKRTVLNTSFVGDFSLDKGRTVVTKALAGSGAKLSGTMNNIYKVCPLLLRRLT